MGFGNLDLDVGLELVGDGTEVLECGGNVGRVPALLCQRAIHRGCQTCQNISLQLLYVQEVLPNFHCTLYTIYKWAGSLGHIQLAIKEN